MRPRCADCSGGYTRDFDLPAGQNALRHPVVSADERLFGRAEQLAVGHGVGEGSTAPPEAGDAGDCRDGDGNTTAQQVVILLEQRGETTDSMRLRQKYYTLNAADDALADPLRRDESLLLTASGTMRTILTCIQQRDIRRLYRYLALSDPDTGEARMEYEAFASKWTEYPALTAFDFSGGSASGTRAVFTVSGTRLADGVSQKFTGRSVHLMKTGGLWCISMSQLTAIVEGTP